MTQKANTKEIIWDQVDIKEPDKCWPWTGHVNTELRGRVNWKGRMVIVPRLIAYFEGILPDLAWTPNTNVLHTCDNPNCCNPAHLYVGSQSDNNRDAYIRKRRTATQCRKGATKLSPAQIEEMRGRYATNKTSKTALARQYGVSPITASRIINRTHNYSK